MVPSAVVVRADSPQRFGLGTILGTIRNVRHSHLVITLVEIPYFLARCCNACCVARCAAKSTNLRSLILLHPCPCYMIHLTVSCNFFHGLKKSGSRCVVYVLPTGS